MTSSSISPDLAGHLPSDDPGEALSVDYVIVTYRSASLIASCLDSIASDRPAGSRIIVVDNHSPDESAAVAMAHPTKPLVITSPTNMGFGGACNLAVRDSTAAVVFFLNPDATLRPGATRILLDALSEDSHVAVAGPRIVDRTGDVGAASAGFEPSIRSIAGHFLLLGRVPGMRRFFRPVQLPDGTQERSVDWVSGAALMARRDAFLEVEGFDRSMFLYMEDVDLCRRLREAGWTIRYERRAVVVHVMGGSQGVDQAERWYVAFHRYVRARRGLATAVLGSLMAAAGMLARAARLRSTKPVHARRLARAGRAALRLAFGRPVDTAKPGAEIMG